MTAIIQCPRCEGDGERRPLGIIPTGSKCALCWGRGQIPSGFPPSAVLLDRSFPPLIDTFGKTEVEIAAAFVVRACQVEGDRWQPVTMTALGRVLRADMEAKTDPLYALSANPFARPDFHRLVAGGYAKWDGDGEPKALELTPAGITALAKWVAMPTRSDS